MTTSWRIREAAEATSRAPRVAGPAGARIREWSAHVAPRGGPRDGHWRGGATCFRRDAEGVGTALYLLLPKQRVKGPRETLLA